MMQAYVSGKAAKVVFVQGDDITYIDAVRPDKSVPVNRGEVKYLFLDADDVQKIEIDDQRQCYDLLLKKYNFDRGLSVLDVALGSYSTRVRVEAAKIFEDLMAHEPSLEAIKNYIFSAPNSSLPDSTEMVEIKQEAPQFFALVEAIARAQIHIVKFQASLELALKASSLNAAERAAFTSAAIESGSFRVLVEAGSDQKAINQAILRCYADLKDHREARTIVMAWTRSVLHKETKTELKSREREFEQFEQPTYQPSSAQERNGYEIYKAVQQQISAIIAKIKVRDVRAARRFADQLVNMQIQNGGTAYAAKSLSKLAMEARKMGQRSLELEWAKASVDLAPDDSKSVRILADTYLDLYHIPEAQAAFARTAELGNTEFGAVGLGRVLKVSGRYDEALDLLQKVMANQIEGQSSFATIAVYAETLRDMWRNDEALEAYENAIKSHPDEPSLLNGKASVLRDIGKLPEAIAIYLEVNSRFGDNPMSWCGLGEVQKLQGNWADALATYDRAIEIFPDNIVAYCGRADVLRSSGDLEHALVEYRQAAKLFPYSPVPVSGAAETLKDMRKFPEAFDLLKKAKDQFPLELRIRNSFANALKLDGRFADALAEFDLNVKDFPYDLHALGGRANLLRLLGRYDAALGAYDDIILRRPDYKFAMNAKAAILIAKREFAAAGALLPQIEPATEVDWATMHIRGMMYVQQGFLEEARRIFTRGSSSPFYRQRMAFETALAMTELHDGHTDLAIKKLAGHYDEISRLLLTRCLFAKGEISEALKSYSAVNDNLPQPLAELRLKIGNELKESNLVSLETERWLRQREIEVVLQAA